MSARCSSGQGNGGVGTLAILAVSLCDGSGRGAARWNARLLASRAQETRESGSRPARRSGRGSHPFGVRMARLVVAGQPAAWDVQRDAVRHHGLRRRACSRGSGAHGQRGRPARAQRRAPGQVLADSRAQDDQAELGSQSRCLDVQRHLARPRTARPPGRPRRSDARQQGHRGWRHDPLARRRRAKRRGRSRRSHPGRCPARQDVHLPVPSRPSGDVLVPHAPVLVGRCGARPLRRLCDPARHETGPNRSRPRACRPRFRRSGGAQHLRWRRRTSRSAWNTGEAPPDQLEQHPGAIRRGWNTLPHRRHRRNRRESPRCPDRLGARTGGRRPIRRRLHDAPEPGTSLDPRYAGAARARPEQWHTLLTGAPWGVVRPSRVRETQTDAFRSVEQVRPAVHVQDRTEARLLRRETWTPVGDQRATSTPMSQCSSCGEATS